MVEERMHFQAEVSRLLEIVAKSLYSQKEVFLRELISNASDACDRLRYAAITEPELLAEDAELRIRLQPDAKARTLLIADNGIGMNRDELVANLGTIARSGTKAFLDSLSGDGRKDMALIGQFGVGFYSAFMVADRVTVLTRRAGETQGWRWESDGKGDFTIAEASDLPRGTQITLHLAEGEDEFLEAYRLRHIVQTYSDHVPLPVVLVSEAGEERVNRAAALWTRPKSDIAEADYKEFYHHLAHAYDEPWLTLHYRAEGVIEYTALLFVPFDLFTPERKGHVKLYVRRVFVAEGPEALVPPFLRFLRGLIDSEDLPLNISREMLQSSRTVSRIRTALTKRVLGELARKAGEDAEAYAAFWKNFGAVLKEGLYEDHEHREDLLKLVRFRTTAGEGLVSLDDYVGRMKPGQEAIYYLTGDDEAALQSSPHLEGFRAKGVEVLLLTDPVDEFWIPAVGKAKDREFRSVTRAGAALSKIEGGEKAAEAEETPPAELGGLVALFRDTLKDQVQDVRVSERLTDSAVCLVSAEGDLDIHLERLLKQHRQLDSASKRILEINPKHRLVRTLADRLTADPASEAVRDMAHLLLDQARIVDGETLPDPAGFSRRLAAALERGLAA